MFGKFENYINKNYLKYLENQHIVKLTDIQKKAIPPIKEGRDLVAISKTGTGKTLAYLLPLMSMVDLEIKSPQIIILTPTHELSAQVFEQCRQLHENDPDGPLPALLIGGANISRQLEVLKKKPRVIVASTGRILELIKMKKLSLHYVKTIVVDEADRMLDMHNVQNVEAVIKGTLRDRQLLFFSATMDNSALKKADELGKNPEIIKAESNTYMPDSIDHIYFLCEQRDKIEILRKVVHAEKIEKGLVFLNNPDNIDNMVKRLNYHNIKAGALFGGHYPKERQQALSDFKSGKITLLVVSDIVARGMDFKNLEYVINLDVPENPVFYLHRGGRTGRMDSKGTVLTIATNKEVELIRKYERKYSISIQLKRLRYGDIID